MSSLEKEVEIAIRKGLSELLETKHLYQSVTVDFSKARSLLTQIADDDFRNKYSIVSSARMPSQDQTDQLKQRIRQKLADRMVNWSNKSWFFIDEKTAKSHTKSLGSDEARINNSRFSVSSIKTFCAKCGSGPWPHNPARDSGDRGYSYEDSENFAHVQIFLIPFQCQNCRGEPLVFLIKRDGVKLTMVGRSQFPEVTVPNFIPNNQQKFYRNSLISDQTNFTLAAALYLRTVIEQYFYEIIPASEIASINGNPTGDELATLYTKTLPEGFPSKFPSLKKAYEDLSVIIHSGIENEDVKKSLLLIRTSVEVHFKAVRLFKEMPIQ